MSPFIFKGFSLDKKVNSCIKNYYYFFNIFYSVLSMIVILRLSIIITNINVETMNLLILYCYYISLPCSLMYLDVMTGQIHQHHVYNPMHLFLHRLHILFNMSILLFIIFNIVNMILLKFNGSSINIFSISHYLDQLLENRLNKDSHFRELFYKSMIHNLLPDFRFSENKTAHVIVTCQETFSHNKYIITNNKQTNMQLLINNKMSYLTDQLKINNCLENKLIYTHQKKDLSNVNLNHNNKIFICVSSKCTTKK